VSVDLGHAAAFVDDDASNPEKHESGESPQAGHHPHQRVGNVIPVVADCVGEPTCTNEEDGCADKVEASSLPASLTRVVFADFGGEFSGGDQGEKSFNKANDSKHREIPDCLQTMVPGISWIVNVIDNDRRQILNS
jgi:hypothetical protein